MSIHLLGEIDSETESLISAFLGRAMKQACQSIGQGQGCWMIMVIITSQAGTLLIGRETSALMKRNNLSTSCSSWHCDTSSSDPISLSHPNPPSFIPLQSSRGGSLQGDFVRQNSSVDLEGLRPTVPVNSVALVLTTSGLSHLKLLLFLMRRGGGAARLTASQGLEIIPYLWITRGVCLN